MADDRDLESLIKIYLHEKPQQTDSTGKDFPTYSLSEMKRLIRVPMQRVLTKVAVLGAKALGLYRDDIYSSIESLVPDDFYKSMPAKKAPGLWQDVYKFKLDDINLYTKLQITRVGSKDSIVVISFKENTGSIPQPPE